MNRARLLFLALVVLLGGCASIGVDVTPSGPAATDGADGTVTHSNDVASTFEVTVTDVVDGDTIDVRYANGTTDRIRFLGVDTPELHAANEPAEFEGVPSTDAGRDCLREAGSDASSALKDRIAGKEVTVVVDATADRRDRYGRLLAYVEFQGDDINHWLVAKGHARVYDTTFARADSYYSAEADTQSAERGVWDCRTESASTAAEADGSLAVVRVHADAAGNDHENLNGEYVVFENVADRELDLTDWTVSDNGGHTFTVPDGFTLASGSQVTLRTGTGTDTTETLYWGRESAVWNNAGDTVTVRNATGDVVTTYSYS